MTAGDAAVIESNPGQDVAAKALDQRHALAGTRRRLQPSRAVGKAIEDLLDQGQALCHLIDADPDSGVDVAGLTYGRLEGERVIGRIGQGAPGVEGALRSPADIAAGGELAGQGGLQNAGSDRAVLQRRGVVIEGDQGWKPVAHDRDEVAETAMIGQAEIDRHTPGGHGIHHQAMAERRGAGAQNLFAQYAAMGVHQSERGVVTDRADVAQMVGETLQLGHEGAQPVGARRRGQAQGRLDRTGEGDRIGDRAVAASPGGEPDRLVRRLANHPRL